MGEPDNWWGSDPVATEPKPKGPVYGASIDPTKRAADKRDEVRLGFTAEGAARDARNEDRNKSNDEFNRAQGVKQDYNADLAVKTYATAIPILSAGLRSAPDATGDNALIYAYAKVMDPNSVVRESEMQMAGSGANMAEQTVARLKKELGIEGGGQLSPAVRVKLRDEMIKKVGEFRGAYNQARSRYGEDAKAFGLDPDRVIGPDLGQEYMPKLQAYDDERRKRGELPAKAGAPASPGNGPIIHPEMRGGLPVGTDIQFGMDKQEGPWDRNAWLMRKYGMTPDQETTLAATLNENIKNLTVDKVNQIHDSLGIARPDPNGVAADIEQIKQGKITRFGNFDDSQDRKAYTDGLQSSLNERGFDPTSGGSYLARGVRGLEFGMSDEIEGLGAAAKATFNLQNPVEAYVRERDAQRMAEDQMRDKQGALGYGAELAGSLLTTKMLPASPVKGGIVAGGLSGFGNGNGVAGSLGGMVGGGVLGGLTGKGVEMAAPLIGRATGKVGQMLGIGRKGAQAEAGGLPVIDATPADTYGTFQKFGMEPSLGDVRGMGAKVTERVLDVQPGSAGIMNAGRENLGKQAVKSVEGVADSFGTPASFREMGDAAQRGAKGWIDRFEAVADKAYQAIPIKPDIKAATEATVGKLTDLTSKITSNPKLAKLMQNPRLVGYLDAIKGDGLSWNDMKQLRSHIGEEIGQQMFGEATLKSDLRGLYGALSTDMEATARSQGPKAYNAFVRANKLYADGQARIEGALTQILGKDGKNAPEAAAALLQRIAKEGKSSSDLGLLREIKASLKPEEWGQVSNGFIRLLGQPVNSEGREFAADTFFRNFVDMAPEAKNMLFGNGELRANLNEFTALMGKMAANKSTRNVSNTAMGLAGLAGYGAGGVLGLMAQAATSAVGAKVWTNPKFVRWAVGYGKALAAAERQGGAMNPQVQKRQFDALSNVVSIEEARVLQDRLSQAFSASPVNRAAAEDERQ